jgi:nickel/cobalt transporter (NicO) family protein
MRARRGAGTVARLAVLASLVVGLLLAWAGAAAAHPLGNFTVNQYSGLRLLRDGVRVDYVVDMAEIAAFQTRQRLDADGDQRVSPAEADAWRLASCPRLAAGMVLRLDGRRLELATASSRLSFPPGAGGLPTLRLECELAATGRLPGGAAGHSHTLAYANGNYTDRVGWREVVAIGDGATVTSSDVPSSSASARLSGYPRDLLRSPPDQRSATVSFRPGGKPANGARAGPGSGRAAVPLAVDRATRAFTELVARQRLSPAFGALAVGLALLLGALHALAPGHGKTVMAAYLLGLRSSLPQALLVASTVTITHTAGILALGVALSASTALAPERIYPWLGLASGLLLASVGASLLRRAVRLARDRVHPGHGSVDDHGGHPDHPGHGHGTHGHGHGTHGHGHGGRPEHPGHGPHGHDHGARGHGHAGARPPGWRGLVSMGFAGGLVPSPSALVVLLGAIALGRAWFGVLLVVAYGAGMAATLTGAGLLLLRARALLDRRADAGPGPRAGLRLRLAPLATALPLASAAAIIVVGLFLAAQGAAGI